MLDDQAACATLALLPDVAGAALLGSSAWPGLRGPDLNSLVAGARRAGQRDLRLGPVGQVGKFICTA